MYVPCVGTTVWPYASGARKLAPPPLPQREQANRSAGSCAASSGVTLWVVREPWVTDMASPATGEFYHDPGNHRRTADPRPVRPCRRTRWGSFGSCGPMAGGCLGPGGQGGDGRCSGDRDRFQDVFDRGPPVDHAGSRRDEECARGIRTNGARHDTPGETLRWASPVRDLVSRRRDLPRSRAFPAGVVIGGVAQSDRYGVNVTWTALVRLAPVPQGPPTGSRYHT